MLVRCWCGGGAPLAKSGEGNNPDHPPVLVDIWYIAGHCAYCGDDDLEYPACTNCLLVSYWSLAESGDGTDEVRRWLFATGVKQQAERDRNVEVDPKNVSFQGGAKADSRLEIQETAEGRATMRIRRVSDHRANTSVQQLGTYP
nr:hypothetical protein Pyn_06004 [Ipomoea batatas]